mgnify:CR=1 FL=1
MDIEYILNDALNKALCQKGRIQHLNSNTIAEFVTKYLQTEKLAIQGVSKRYFLFECTNADKQKIKKLIIAPDRETAIADIETNYPYIIK